MNGWKAHVVDGFLNGSKRLIIFRDVGDQTEFNNADGTWSRHDLGTVSAEAPGYVLPHGAWEAIEALVLPKAKDGEIAMLKEALDLERRRVDSVLDAYLPESSQRQRHE